MIQHPLQRDVPRETKQTKDTNQEQNKPVFEYS